uniref:Protein TIC 214 n=2 Tax=Elaeagnus TaxID=36776 RepID=A0A6F8UN05_9ROSA|nr:hypothetical chloroplast RF19 [Elaeagnus multiflora]
MILKSFILGNLVSLCMKIINSVVVVGLYYGFLTTFSIGPSYLFLLRARVMEEGTEKKVSATTGFITGQLMMFISIYYVPLHLALGRPHTITVLALPYLLFHFFWNNHKHFFDYGSTNRNSMRNLSIQCVFLNNLIFQLFNHFILPSSMLVRLVNIYMFRCNNKMLFVTSSFVGWLIGHILFMKWVGLVLVWIQQNHSIRSNKYLVSELRNSMARIFSILLFITCVYYLGRIPSPIITKKLKETSKTEERGESEEETDVEIETTSETKETKQEQEGSTEEDPSPSLFSEEKEDPNKIDETKEIRVNGKEKTKDEFHFKDTRYQKKPVYETYYLNGNQENSKSEIFKAKKDILWFEKPLVTILFDYKRWNRPLRYIKNNRFENAVRNEMSQYFFYTCQSDGIKKISFTYPPSLSTFFEMLQKKMSIFTTEKQSSKEKELYNNWIYGNEQKRKNVTKKFLNRIKNLDKALDQAINGRPLLPGILEKRTQFCNDNIKNEYLQKMYDPLLKGPYRGRIKKSFSSSIINEISMKNYIESFWINKIHGILLIINYLESKQKKSTFESENRKKDLKFLFDRVINDPKNYIGITEISKKVPRWSYKLKNDLEQKERENDENAVKNHEIRLRKFKRVVIFTDNLEKNDAYTTTKDTNNTDQKKEWALVRYSQQSDFRRDIIKGSMRTQRRKTIIWNLFEANVHSPLFLDRIDKDVFFSFDTSEPMKIFFKNGIGKNTEFKNFEYTEKKIEESEKKQEENKIKNDKKRDKTRIEIAEAWDSFLFAQVLRGLLLVTHSFFRKNFVLPSLIIIKNIVRMLLFQFPEWSEDFKDWNREMHVKCTYNGVLLSEKEFPKNWLTDGIQIKILYPFHLQPWHKLKPEKTYKDTTKTKEQKNDFCFLTVWGKETELPFGSPRKKFSFFEPIFKELKTKIIKWKRKCFLVLSILKEITKFFLNTSKEIKKWVIKKILFLKEIRKEFIKLNPIFGLKKIYEFNENKKEKDSIISNELIHELSIEIQSIDWTNSSLKKKKIKNLTNRTNTVINQIQKIAKDNKKEVLISDISSNKMGYYDKRLELSQNIFKILKKKNARGIRKSYYFIKMFIERVYIDIFLGIKKKVPSINAQLFYESTNQILNKYIKYFYNNETNQEQERMEKSNQSRIQFISTIKKSLCNFYNNRNRSQTLFDLSYLSQAYVFYKLSQPPGFNSYLYKLRSAFEYNGSSHFLKNEIKNYFVRSQEIFHYELRHKNIQNSGMNQWKNWLNSNYQYDLSTIRWFRLISQKWRNRVNQHSIEIEKSKHLNKYDSYEKKQLINQEQKNNFKADSLWNQKENYKKQYKYGRLSYQFISYESSNYEDKKNSSIYGFPLEGNKNQEFFYNYSEDKRKLDNMLEGIPINNSNYLFEDDILYIEKNPDRKYFDWITLRFCLTKKVDIETWINIDPDMNRQKYPKTTKGWINNSQIIDKINNKSIFYLPIHQNKKKKLLDWMGMNNEILSCPISNLELWFFPEFVILYNVYKINPWAIPIKLLLLNFKINENASENKSITGNKKKSIELENINQEEKESEKESTGQADFDSSLPNPEKEVAENYAGSKIKKVKNKKEYRNNTEAELNFFLKKYLRFQLKWGGIFNQKIMNNVKVYCLLLRLINPQEITISSIQRGEMSLDILMIQKKLTFPELMKEGIFIIEPVRLSMKNEGQFFVYQTIGISLVHKSKHEIFQKYLEKDHVDKKTSSKFIAKHEKMAGNRYTNFYDLFVPENILSPRCRRNLRILICFNSKNRNCMPRNTAFCNGKKINSQAWDKSKKDKKKRINFKFFLCPNFRLEDLACMNRYWFDTNNGSRFSMIRIHMYPRLIIP